MNNLAHLMMSLSYVPNDSRVPETMRIAAAEIDQQEKRIKELENQLALEKQQTENAKSTLEAWFDLATCAEEAGADVLRDSLETWLRRSSNGGMPVDQINLVRCVVDDAARSYLWRALVPILRQMINRRANGDGT